MTDNAARSATTAPALSRTLGLRAVVSFGLAYMTPLIVLGTFGVVAEKTAGAVPTAYALALVAMLFTAYSYGKMATEHPVAGSAYTYVRRSIDGRAGFLVGWATLLDYFFLPMVIWLIGGAYLQAEWPGVPMWVWILAFVVVTTALNLLGIQAADRANSLLMAFQILVIAIFALLSLRHAFHAEGAGGVFSTGPFHNDATTLAGISGGAAIAAYSFLGFDAVTTLTEETVEPRRTMPRAIMLTALIGGGIFIALAYTTQLAHPGSSFDDPSSAAFEIARTIGGDLFSSVFLAGLVVAQFASGVAAQASTSRLLYAMGRDDVLPRKLFGYIHPRHLTPAFNILLTGVVGLVALRLDVATSTSFINFGAFTAFTFVNLSVIATFLRKRRAGEPAGVLAWAVVPAVGALIDLWLLLHLDGKALTLGVIWLALGVAYLAYLTRGFRRPPPELTFDEREGARRPADVGAAPAVGARSYSRGMTTWMHGSFPGHEVNLVFARGMTLDGLKRRLRGARREPLTLGEAGEWAWAVHDMHDYDADDYDGVDYNRLCRGGAEIVVFETEPCSAKAHPPSFTYYRDGRTVLYLSFGSPQLRGGENPDHLSPELLAAKLIGPDSECAREAAPGHDCFDHRDEDHARLVRAIAGFFILPSPPLSPEVCA